MLTRINLGFLLYKEGKGEDDYNRGIKAVVYVAWTFPSRV